MEDCLSLLCPPGKAEYERNLPEATYHDLAVDALCEQLSDLEPERNQLRRMMSRISGDPEVVQYRLDVFEDILCHPKMREQMQKLLDRVDFLKTYGSFDKGSDAAGVWELVHRLDEMDEYIQCVQAIYTCLNENEVTSQGLLNLKDYVRRLYEDNGFAELKKDIDNLKVDASKIRSVTLGVNLNDRFEPVETGIVSINEKPFTKSNVISNFCEFLNRKDDIRPDTEWNGNMTFRTSGIDLSEAAGSMERVGIMRQGLVVAPGLAMVPSDSRGGDVIRTLDRAISALLTRTVKKLKTVLSKHVSVSTHTISALIPEFLYYIRWAEYIEKLQNAGFTFCKPQLLGSSAKAAPEDRSVGKSTSAEAERVSVETELADAGTANSAGMTAGASLGTREMWAKGLYNLRLAQSLYEKGESADTIVPNDLDFCAEHRIYILTGANRGGKTTITQAVGLAFLLAQSGLYVPATSFTFDPVDNIFTHYPADENQTMDLGRLGEESSRFRDLFREATPRSLLLLNESFSTTSFEEGYFIARDVTRILRRLGVRTIYNTHMHKLAIEMDELNQEEGGDSKIASLVVEAEDGNRSYRVKVAPPGGKSYAQDIAEKYGVTYRQLEQEKSGML
ncbi:MAG: DNA mismatch repair protein [Lachnospiraceae bacterium]|nr:DNA mismatch repair protein [Lachnospiraceae bacterium]